MGGPNFNATVRANSNPGVQGISPNGNGVEGRSGAAIPIVPSQRRRSGHQQQWQRLHGTSATGPGVDGRSPAVST